MFSKILGVVTIVVGLFLAVYIGLVVMFVGGISEAVDGFDAHPHDGHRIGWGIAKAVLAGSVTEVIAFLVIVAGIGVFTSGSIRSAIKGWRAS